VTRIDVPLGEVPVCSGRSHPTTGGVSMQRRRTYAPEESSQPPPQESSRENIRPVSEVSSWRQSAQRACAPGHPSWGLPPDRVHPRLHSPQNRHSIYGRSMLPPPAATQSPLPTHSRDPTASATARSGLRHGTINLVSEAPLMFLKLTPCLLLPLHTLLVVPN
jgi:hypothetical protein